jgi:LmbE family N-acetylglucosaminyl deacetylase
MIYIISPHIDDAVLSLGGLIINRTANDKRVTVENIFTVSDWVNPESIKQGVSYQFEDKLAGITAIRKSEEKNVSEKLNYIANFWDLLDAPLRGNDDINLSTLVETKIKSFLTKDDTCYFPLGFGHPDHTIARTAGIKLFNQRFNVFFYEDMPYAAFGDYNYQEQCNFLLNNGLTPGFEEIDIEAKIEALQLYGSQVSYDWLKGIKNYSYNAFENSFFERYWQPADLILNI